MSEYEDIKQRLEAYNKACETPSQDRTNEQWTLWEEANFSIEAELLLKALELSLKENVGRMRTNRFYLEREDDPDYWMERIQGRTG
jgi:hypothetical protein